MQGGPQLRKSGGPQLGNPAHCCRTDHARLQKGLSIRVHRLPDEAVVAFAFRTRNPRDDNWRPRVEILALRRDSHSRCRKQWPRKILGKIAATLDVELAKFVLQWIAIEPAMVCPPPGAAKCPVCVQL